MKFFLFLFLLISAQPAAAQLPERRKNHARVPETIALAATELHLYVLSEKEGLAVYRNFGDSLAFLYKAEGMQRRGNQLSADARFAYLISGDRISVIEPTSLLGVYSSTTAPGPVTRVVRAGSRLYAAAGRSGLLAFSLSSPDAFDQPPIRPLQGITAADAVDLFQQGSQIFVLTSEPSVLVLHTGGDSLSLQRKIPLDRPLAGVLAFGETVWGYDALGNFYQPGVNGKTLARGSVKEPISQSVSWNRQLVLRTRSGAVWIMNADGTLLQLRRSGSGGNFLASARGRLWMTEFDYTGDFALPQARTARNGGALTAPKLAQVADAVVTYPRPFLGTVDLQTGDPADVQIVWRSSTADGGTVEGQGLYWQPASSQVGRHRVTLVASNGAGQTDSVQFHIDVRPFNAPPRFTPVPVQHIAAGYDFELPVRAVDPDGLDAGLVRYIASDLPEGARLDERTGLFVWKPLDRHLGNHRFRVVATDQFGAAAAVDIQLVVQKAVR